MKRTANDMNSGPQAFEVIQRSGAPAAGQGATGRVTVRLAAPPAAAELLYRVRPLGQHGQPASPIARAPCELGADGRWTASLPIPQGGWYALDCSLVAGQTVLAKDSFGPFGIGERFLIAGQSYAGNHHDVLLGIDDPDGRVVAFDRAGAAWRIAHDPQPSWLQAQMGDSHWRQLGQEILRKGYVFHGGSVWPAAMNALLPTLAVPVGLLSVVRSASTLADWLPGGALFASLAEAVRHFHPFRAILWQLGEADAGRMTTSDAFLAQFVQLQQALAAATGVQATWMIAKSTYHPAAHDNEQGQRNVRDAVDRLCGTLDHVVAGPDMDLLGREYRQIDRHSRHFTAEGQRKAGALWAQSLGEYLGRGPRGQGSTD